MRIDVVTIFPDAIKPFLASSLLGKAADRGLIDVVVHDLRDYSSDKHRKVDDEPYGGGPGMVMTAQPWFAAVERIGEADRVILLSPQGRTLTQSVVKELAALRSVVLLCGRYEGVDERVAEHLADEELSIGDYVLSGGELGAAVIVDTVVRLVPGAVGNEASTRQESFTASVAPATGDAPSSTCDSGGLLDYPHYTRPAEFRGMTVPEVLVNGNHDQIRRWRRRTALEKTLRNRPDLIDAATLSDEDRMLLAEMKK